MNPLFQLRYKRDSLGPPIRNDKAFKSGLVLGVIALFIDMNWLEKKVDVFLVSIAILSAPGLFLLLVEWMKGLSACLVTSARRYRREKVYGELDIILTAPLSDQAMYFSLFVPTLVWALRRLEAPVAYFAGVFLPYLIGPYVMYIYALRWVEGLPMLIFKLGLLFFWGFGVLVLVLVLTALAVAFYSMMSTNIYAVVASAVSHVVFLCLVSSAFLLVIAFTSHGKPVEVGGMVSAALFQLTWLVLASYATSWMGLFAFSRSRRPGYHEDDQASAVDFMLRGG